METLIDQLKELKEQSDEIQSEIKKIENKIRNSTYKSIIVDCYNFVVYFDTSDMNWLIRVFKLVEISNDVLYMTTLSAREYSKVIDIAKNKSYIVTNNNDNISIKRK